MKSEDVVAILQSNKFVLDNMFPVQYGVQLVYTNGAKVTVYKTGTVTPQGRHIDLVKKLLHQHLHREDLTVRQTTVSMNDSPDDDLMWERSYVARTNK